MTKRLWVRNHEVRVVEDPYGVYIRVENDGRTKYIFTWKGMEKEQAEKIVRFIATLMGTELK